MITSLKLVQFRNFQNREFFFSDGNNFILGDNGQGKTNILEAIALLSGNSLLGIHFDNLVMTDCNFFSIECITSSGDKLRLFYDSEKSKKQFSINGKNISRKKYREHAHKSVLFSPMIMNILYLSPSLRREFLDGVLSNSYSDYAHVLKKYKQCVQQRNGVLKNISKNLSTKSELKFWDEQFTILAGYIYNKRKKLINFLITHQLTLGKHIEEKIKSIIFSYDTQINLDGDIIQQITQTLEDNLQKDIILRSTSFGPHRDDFNIYINSNIPLIDFASRGEVKTAVLALKKLEILYIKEICMHFPILILDDLLSELDDTNKNYFINEHSYKQSFISAIDLELVKNSHSLLLGRK